MKLQHTIIFSYFSEPEVERYKLLAHVLAGWQRSSEYDVRCLICTVVTGAPEDPELYALMSAIMPTSTYRCQTTVVGYPQRPTAMFWEIMEHVAETDSGDGGFALWFEADMVPARPSWLDELHREWVAHRGPLVMGRYQPRRYVPTAHIVTSPHINGGACYAKQYARQIEDRYKRGAFDGMPWPQLKRSGRYAAVDLFRYSTLAGLADDMKSTAAVLHGYRQDKSAFYKRWAALMAGEDIAPPADVTCCDLWAQHFSLTYCPIHGPHSWKTRVANVLSVAAVTPYLSARRRLLKLRGDRR